jgi:two-component system response regulator AdeR
MTEPTLPGDLVLIAEDEHEIAEILSAYFAREGFRTICASNGKIALQHHRMLGPDIVILDINMPLIDGYGVLNEIRRRDDTPVIMVTALADDLDKLSALRTGADDYVVKPFNPMEVVARAKAVLRRTRGRGESKIIRYASLEIDLSAHTARVLAAREAAKPHALSLTLTEFRILVHLARTPTKVFSRTEILDACSSDSDALERTIDSHISNLRRKLEAAGQKGLLVGVRGIGYRMAAE